MLVALTKYSHPRGDLGHIPLIFLWPVSRLPTDRDVARTCALLRRIVLLKFRNGGEILICIVMHLNVSDYEHRCGS